MYITMILDTLIITSLYFVNKSAKLTLVDTQHRKNVEVADAVGSQKAQGLRAPNFFHEAENVKIEAVSVLELLAVTLLSEKGDRVLSGLEVRVLFNAIQHGLGDFAPHRPDGVHVDEGAEKALVEFMVHTALVLQRILLFRRKSR